MLAGLKTGSNIGELPKNYVIFICSFPIFDGKKHRYTFRNQCQEDSSIYLEDETEKIFISTKGTERDVDDKMLNFLAYVEHSDASYQETDTSFIKKLKKQVEKVKNNKVLEVEYLTFETRMAEKFQEGCEEGILKNSLQIARKMLNKGIAWEEITEMTGITEKDWERHQDM